MQCAVSDAKKGEGEGRKEFTIFWKKEGCKGKACERESPQGKANRRRKLHVWGRGKEDNELDFKGKSARIASCREMANTYRNSKEKKKSCKKIQG